jgi:hypothetical protein
MGEKHRENGATKVLNFADAAFLRLPIDWVVVGEEGGGIAIYEDRPGSGTLRPWTEEFAFDDPAIRDAAADDVHGGKPFDKLNEKTTLSYSINESEEAEVALQLHTWIIAVRKNDSRLQVVTFTHTVDAGSESRNDTDGELWIIAEAIRGALYPGTGSDSSISPIDEP